MTEFGSIGTKVLSAVNSIAPVAGAAAGWLSAPLSGGLDAAPAFIIDRLTHFKIANPVITTQIALNEGDSKYPIISGIISAITGMAVKEVGDAVDVAPISKMGGALSKYGGSAAINAIIAAWVWEAKNNPHGAGSSSGTTMSYSTVKQSNTISVDNPQGLSPLYTGISPDFSRVM